MDKKDQLNKNIHNVDQSIGNLARDTVYEINPLINSKNHIDKWSNFKSAELDTKGVRRNRCTKYKSDFYQQNIFKRKSASLPTNSYLKPKCADGSFKDGYSLFVKYRHVYAGTGNWFKRAPYKHAYPARGSSSISSSRTHTDQDAENKKLLHRREVMRKLANNLQLTKPKESKVDQQDLPCLASDWITFNTFPEETERKKSADSETNQPEVNKWHNPENDSRQISLDLHNNHHGNHSLISQSKYNRQDTVKSDTLLLKNRNESVSKDHSDFEPKRDIAIENFIDCAGHEEDATFTRRHIDKSYTSLKMKPPDKLKNQSVATEVSRVDKHTIDSEQTVNGNKQGKESPRSQGFESVICDVSTRTGMKMLSRLSLEARTAMHQAKNEVLNRIDVDETPPDTANCEEHKNVSHTCSNDSIEEIRTVVSCQPQSSSDTKEHTEECTQVTKITEGKIECCCPHEQRKHFSAAVKKQQIKTVEKDRYRKGSYSSKNFIRSISVDRGLPKKQKTTLKKCETRTELHEERKEGDGKDHLRTLTKNDKHISNKGFPPQRVVPLSMVGREGTFQITPAGYDSRFSDRPAVLDVEHETLKEIRNIAIQKCNDWLLNHTQ